MTANPVDRLPGPIIHLITWPSLALGIAGVARPSAVAGLIGVDQASGGRAIRLAGWRELIVLAAFLARPVRGSLWLFVGQDVCDLSTGIVLLGSRPGVLRSRKRLLRALFGYSLLAVGDVMAVRLSR